MTKKYICQRCGYESCRKSSLKNHINKKSTCPPILGDISKKDLLSNLEILHNERDDPIMQDATHKCINYAKNDSQMTHKCINYAKTDSETTLTKSHNKCSKCPYCQKEFTRRNNLNRHMNKYCKTRKMVDNQVETLYNILSEVKGLRDENNELKKQIEDNNGSKNTTNQSHHNENHNKSHNTNNSHNSMNNSNNNSGNNTVIINNFNSENNQHLYTKKYIDKIAKGDDVNMLKNYIHYSHFDPDFPENHNVKVTNVRGNYGSIFKNGKWCYEDIGVVTGDIFNSGVGYFDDLKGQIDDRILSEILKLDWKYDNDDKRIAKEIKFSLLYETEFLK